jgi:GNAT superfamily N-acetyltransferase
MNIMIWASFCWDLEKADLPEIAAPKHYRLGIVGAEDHEETRKMIGRSFALDPTWNSALHEANAVVENAIARALNSATTTCLALRHGSRIIAGTFLAVDPNASEQFIPGPCVLMEYRNRGLGTLLLAAAMQQLRNAGLKRACAITHQGSPVARFLYPKFDGRPSPIVPLLAA